MSRQVGVLDRGCAVRTERRAEVALTALLPLLVARPSLVTVAGALANMVGLPSALGSLSVHTFLAVVVAIALSAILRRTDVRAVVFCWLVVTCFLLGILVGQRSFEFYSAIALDLLTGLGWMLVAYSVRDFERCRTHLWLVGLVILAGVVIQLARMSSGAVDFTYSQYIAYLALPAVLIFFDASLRRSPLLNGALATLSGLLMMSAGARGPLVVTAAFIIARVLLHVRTAPRTAAGIVGVGVLLTGLALRFFVQGLEALQALLGGLGFSVRVIERMLEGTLLQDRARSALSGHAFDVIQRHPLTGVGMANERPILAEKMGAAVADDALGWYPHNIVIEIWAQFGVIFGTILLLFLLAGMVRAIMGVDDVDRGAVTLLFAGLGFMPLIFSASYISWPSFFGLVGLCLSARSATAHSRVKRGTS